MEKSTKLYKSFIFQSFIAPAVDLSQKKKKGIFVNLINLMIWCIIFIQVNRFVCTNPFRWLLWAHHVLLFMNLWSNEWIRSINFGQRTWIMGFWFCSDFMNDWKSCATLTTKCIKINTSLSVRYFLIHLYWAVEVIPFFYWILGELEVCWENILL